VNADGLMLYHWSDHLHATFKNCNRNYLWFGRVT